MEGIKKMVEGMYERKPESPTCIRQSEPGSTYYEGVEMKMLVGPLEVVSNCSQGSFT
jgi:hypothetical protein